MDTDLAALYGVTAKRLNEQVRRNLDRFPEDFVVQAFVRLRVLLASNAQLARRIDDLEKSVAVLDADSRCQFKELRA